MLMNFVLYMHAGMCSIQLRTWRPRAVVIFQTVNNLDYHTVFCDSNSQPYRKSFY
jgi:hypothetical protein